MQTHTTATNQAVLRALGLQDVCQRAARVVITLEAQQLPKALIESHLPAPPADTSRPAITSQQWRLIDAPARAQAEPFDLDDACARASRVIKTQVEFQAAWHLAEMRRAWQTKDPLFGSQLTRALSDVQTQINRVFRFQ